MERIENAVVNDIGGITFNHDITLDFPSDEEEAVDCNIGDQKSDVRAIKHTKEVFIKIPANREKTIRIKESDIESINYLIKKGVFGILLYILIVGLCIFLAINGLSESSRNAPHPNATIAIFTVYRQSGNPDTNEEIEIAKVIVAGNQDFFNKMENKEISVFKGGDGESLACRKNGDMKSAVDVRICTLMKQVNSGQFNETEFKIDNSTPN